MKQQTKQSLPTAKEWADSGFDVPAELCSDQPQPVAGHTPLDPDLQGIMDLLHDHDRLARENEALREACNWMLQELCEAWDENPETAIPERFRAALALSTPVQAGSIPKTHSDAATGTPEGKE